MPLIRQVYLASAFAGSSDSHRKLSLPADIRLMLLQWKGEVVAAAKRKAKRQKVVTLDNPVAADKWLFTKHDGSVAHHHGLNCFLKTFCQDNKLPTVGPHTFRHLSGSYLLRSGVDLATVSSILGHADKAFTMHTYIHEIQSAKDAAPNTMQAVLQDLRSGIKKEGQVK